jgi:hypothetical protein
MIILDTHDEFGVTYFNKTPLKAIPIGTPSEKQRLTSPILKVLSSSVVMSAI